MKYAIFFCIMLIALLSSCETHRNIAESIIPIEFHEDRLHSSHVFQKQDVVKLSSSQQDAIIKDARRILCVENRIFIVDRADNKLVAFDYQGNFIKSTLGLVGHSQDEYIHLQDAAIDTISQSIYLYCDVPYQMMVLDYDFHVKQCIKMKELFTEISLDSAFVYALCPDVNNESRYEIRCYRKDNLLGDYDVLIVQDKAIPRVRGFGRYINGNFNNTYACMPFDHIIYEISNGAVQKSWNLDFDGKWYDSGRSGNLKGVRFIQENDNLHWTVQNVIASTTFFLFNSNQTTVFKASHLAKEGIGYAGFVNDSIPFSSSWFIPTTGKYDVALMIPATQIVNYKNYYQQRNQMLPKTSIYQTIMEAKEEDNPLLILNIIK